MSDNLGRSFPFASADFSFLLFYAFLLAYVSVDARAMISYD